MCAILLFSLVLLSEIRPNPNLLPPHTPHLVQCSSTKKVCAVTSRGEGKLWKEKGFKFPFPSVSILPAMGLLGPVQVWGAKGDGKRVVRGDRIQCKPLWSIPSWSLPAPIPAPPHPVLPFPSPFCPLPPPPHWITCSREWLTVWQHIGRKLWISGFYFCNAHSCSFLFLTLGGSGTFHSSCRF